ncbi:MAG TPA: OmpH family outer membrane protein [Burkholderiales bacterium]
MKWVRAFVAAAALGGAALAQADEIRVGYVDLRQVMIKSQAGQRAKNEIEKLIAERRATLKREEQAIREMQQAFEKEKLLLSESQKQAKQKEFEEKVRAFQQAQLEAQREVERHEREFARKAIPEVREIIREIAREQKLTLVFEKNEMPVLYAVDGPDITDKVIQRFNAKSKASPRSGG